MAGAETERPPALLDHAPPRWQPNNVRRSRVKDALATSIDINPVTVVNAPSGFGKTTAVSDWCESTELDVAWLTIDRFDVDPVRLSARVFLAMQTLLLDGPRGGQLAALGPENADGALALDTVTAALAAHPRRVCLVLDDAHHAESTLTQGLLGALLNASPNQFRLVAIGRGRPSHALARWVLGRERAVVDEETLAMTVAETAEILRSGKHSGSAIDPSVLVQATQGWPIAVQFARLTGVLPGDGRDDGLLRRYLQDHVLGELPDAVRSLVCATSICAELTVPLAIAVSGRADAGELLQQCLDLGLFLDSYETRAEVRYRWHPMFAGLCEEIARSGDPAGVDSAHAAAARHLERADPLAAIEHWIGGGRPDSALRVIMARWVRIAVSVDVAALERICAALPDPYRESPEILLVRACAHDAMGASDTARTLLAQATTRAGSDPGDSFRYTLAVAHLFLLDDRGAIATAAATVHGQLMREHDSDPLQRATILFLLGWAGMRHRLAPTRTIEELRLAADEADTLGDSVLAQRARRVLAFVLAWAGQHGAAGRVLEGLGATADDDAPWLSHGGGQVAAATGLICFWADDVPAATAAFRRVLRAERTATSFSGVARLMLVLCAARAGDLAALSEAAAEMDRVPHRDRHGVSWNASRDLARAVIADARGRTEEALEIAHRYENTGNLPLVSVLLAEIVRRRDSPERALASLRRLRRYQDLSYVRASALVTAAIVHRVQGSDRLAHELCEQALDIGAREDLIRVFTGRDAAMRELLRSHLSRGSRHDAFIARALGKTDATALASALTARERTVLDLLQTTMTTAEIAAALDVSTNTLKTHTRGIYRKLGVRSRREATRTDS